MPDSPRIPGLMLAPFRLTIWAATVAAREARGALRLAGELVEAATPRRSERPPAAAATPAPESSGRVGPGGPSAGRPQPAPPVPDVVSEEPVLTAEFAEPGAEEGAGAELHVDEPWEGYDRLAAGELRGELAEASPETLAAVRLYEGLHRGRQSVLDLVERRLREASA